MPTADFAVFTEHMLAAGFDTVLERTWPPGAEVENHRHPFALEALVVTGEMWLDVAGKTQHLYPGARFALAADELHAERYGAQGATYWVARRNPPGGG